MIAMCSVPRAGYPKSGLPDWHSTSDRWPREREREDVQRERERQARERAQLVEGQHDTPTQPIFGEPIKVDPKREDEMSRRVKSTLGDYHKVQRILIDDPKHLIGISRSAGVVNNVQSRLQANPNPYPPMGVPTDNNNAYRKPAVANGQHKSLLSNNHQISDHHSGAILKPVVNKEAIANWNGLQGKPPPSALLHPASSGSGQCKVVSEQQTLSKTAVHASSSSVGDVRRHGKHNSQPDRTMCALQQPSSHQKGGARSQQSHKSVASDSATKPRSNSSAHSSASVEVKPVGGATTITAAATTAKTASVKVSSVPEPVVENGNDDYIQLIFREMTSFPSPVSAIVTPEREESKDDSVAPLSPLESGINISDNRKNSGKATSDNVRTKPENPANPTLQSDLSISDSEDDAATDSFANKSSSSLPPEIKSIHNEIYHPPSPIEKMSSSSDGSSSESDDSTSGSDSEDSDSSSSNTFAPEQTAKAPTKSWSLINFVERKSNSPVLVAPVNNVAAPLRPTPTNADSKSVSHPLDSSKLPFQSLADVDSVNCILTNYSNTDIKEYLTSPTPCSLDLETGAVDVPCEAQLLVSPLRSPCVEPQSSPGVQDAETTKAAPDPEWSLCDAEEKVGSCQLQRCGVLKIRLSKTGSKTAKNSAAHRNSGSAAQGDSDRQLPESTPSYNHHSNDAPETCNSYGSKSATELNPHVPLSPISTAVVSSANAPSIRESSGNIASKGNGESSAKPRKHLSQHKTSKERDKVPKKESSESQKGHSQKSKGTSGSSGKNKEVSQKTSSAEAPSKSSNKSKNSSKKGHSSGDVLTHPEKKTSRGGEGQERKTKTTLKIKSKEIISDTSSSSDSESQEVDVLNSAPSVKLVKNNNSSSQKELKTCVSKSKASSCDKPSSVHSKSPKKAPSSKSRDHSREKSRTMCNVTEVINRVALGDCNLDRVDKLEDVKPPLEHLSNDVLNPFSKSSPMIKLEPPKLLSPIPNGFTPTHQQDYKESIHSLPVRIKLSLLERIPSCPAAAKELLPGNKYKTEVQVSPPLVSCDKPVVKQEQGLQDHKDNVQDRRTPTKITPDAKDVLLSRTPNDKVPDLTKSKTSSKRKLEDASKGSEKKHKGSSKSTPHHTQQEKSKVSRKIIEAESVDSAGQWEPKAISGSGSLVRCDSASSICSFSSQKSQSRSTKEREKEKEVPSEASKGKPRNSDPSPAVDKNKRSGTPSSEKESSKRKDKQQHRGDKKEGSRERKERREAENNTKASGSSKKQKTEAAANDAAVTAAPASGGNGNHDLSSQVSGGLDESGTKGIKSTKNMVANREPVASADSASCQADGKKLNSSQQNHNRTTETPCERTYPTLNELNAKLYSTEVTLAEAKSLKREADKEEDKTLQVIKYVKAVLYFTLTGMSMEQENVDVNRTYQMFKETNTLIRHITSKFLRIQNYASSSYVDTKLAVLSLRCQALLYLKMHSLRRMETKDCRRAFTDFQRSPAGRAISQPSPVPPSLQTPSAFRLSHPSPCQPRTGSNGGTSGVPSPHSPTPSPAGSVASVGSQSSGYSSSELGGVPGRSSGGSTGGGGSQQFLVGGSHGSHGTPSSFAPSHASSLQPQQPSGMVSIPEHIYNMMNKLINLQSNLQMCYDLWEQADMHTNRTQSKEFFKELEKECGPLTLESTFIQLFHYVYAGLERLERIYVST